MCEVSDKISSTSKSGSSFNSLVCYSFDPDVHTDPKWKSLGNFVELRLKNCLKYLRVTLKFMTVFGVMTIMFLAINYYFTDFIIFYCPMVSRELQHFIQVIFIIVLTPLFLLIITVMLTLGFYFVTILYIFIDSIKVLDQDLESVEVQYIRKLHRLHLEILKKLQEFETLFSQIQIVQTATSLPLIVGGQLLLRFYPSSFIWYLICMLFVLDFFAFCVFGEFIHSKTEQIFTALYITRWYEMSLEDQMILLMMMKNTITPFTLMAAGMYNINMASFLEVMKLSFTYSAILFALN
ncbi:hypothetical protein DMENIID0001_168560 [Sergentomyia squamirostris]